MRQRYSKVVFGLLCAVFFSPSLLVAVASESKINSERPYFAQNALLFAGNANPELALEVAENLGVGLGKLQVKQFNDGEIQVRVDESVRNKEIFILQSTCSSGGRSVNDHIMELFLLVRTMKRASAASITAVIPYYGYARQDRKVSPRVPISAADIAILFEEAGVDRVVTVDLHCGQIQGFFRNAPVDNLTASGLFIDHFVKKNLKNIVVVAPDAGGVDRAKKFMEQLQKKGHNAQMAIISKQRAGAGVIDSMKLIGEVSGAEAIIIDDLCDTAGTLVQAAQLLKDKGASRVYAAITHPVFSGPALSRIKNSVIEELVITNTIPLSKDAPSNITSVSCAGLLAEAIYRIHLGGSVSELFK